MATEEFLTPGVYTWTCPAGVTAVTVELWGAGGNGEEGSNPNGGGGGGGYGRITYGVEPETEWEIVVGEAGGEAATGNSTFNNEARAYGGANGAGNAPGLGGTYEAVDVGFDGGTGGIDLALLESGGGGGGTSDGLVPGTDAVVQVAGAINGGTGGSLGMDGNNATGYGGGGGGCGTGGSTAGIGGNGRVLLTYTVATVDSGNIRTFYKTTSVFRCGNKIRGK